MFCFSQLAGTQAVGNSLVVLDVGVFKTAVSEQPWAHLYTSQAAEATVDALS